MCNNGIKKKGKEKVFLFGTPFFMRKQNSTKVAGSLAYGMNRLQLRNSPGLTPDSPVFYRGMTDHSVFISLQR